MSGDRVSHEVRSAANAAGAEPVSLAAGSRTLLVALARVVNALFFVVTATYCILTYSSFAYQQFIRPHVVASIAGFAAFHHLWHWVLLAITVVTLIPEWKSARGRSVAWAYVVAMALVGALVSYQPVLPAVENDQRGLWLACAFLVPPLWLAAYDHLATASQFTPSFVDIRRFVVSAAATAVTVWAVNVVCLPLRSNELGDFTTTWAGMALGALTSLGVHAATFVVFGALLALTLTACRRASNDSRLQYCVLVLSACGVAAVAIRGLVFKPLNFSGAPAWVLATELSLVLTGTWSALAVRLRSGHGSGMTAFDAWTAPVPGSRSRAGAATGVIVLGILLFVVLQRVEKVDWNFFVQNLCVVTAWLLTCAFVHRLVPQSAGVLTLRPIGVAAAIVAVAVGGLGASAATLAPASGHAFVPEFELDAYATLDPSYRLIRQALTVESTGERDFFAYLRSNSLIEHVDVKPIDIDFVRPLHARPERPPHVFLFIIDSLRRDYLSAYNPKVTFTPSFGRFATEEYAFQRAFTQYGGTGLSMPAMWAGSMILHKEYVLPFTRMNALEKLLLANNYRLAMGMGDPIATQLIAPQLPLAPLDQGKSDGQMDFCDTLQELEGRLEAGLGDHQPLLVHTRPMNLHVSKLTQREGAPDPAFGEFHPAAAAAVQRLDRCFGRFIAFLKQQRLYDDSIVILTSDHGDALGESKRWGHAYTIFPEIVRIPLLVHIPSRLRTQFTADLEAASVLTDLTPSLYTLLGYSVEPHGWPQGRSLFVPPGTDTSWRRSEPALVASSYGPVYGVLRDNGRALYIADGVNTRDYAYDISGLKPIRVGVTAERRAADRALILEKLASLASLYHFTPTK